MPVLSVLERLWYYLSFTQLSLWHRVSHLDYRRLKEIISFTGGIPLTRQDGEFNLLHRLDSNPVFDLLGKYLVTYQGEINETTHISFLKEDSTVGPLVYRGSNVQRYDFVEEAKQGKELYLDCTPSTRPRVKSNLPI